MAYVSGIDDEDELLKVGMAPAGGAAPGAAQPSAPAAGGGAGSRGTGFVNFNSLLGLNAAGGQQMAGALTGDLAQRAGSAQSAFDSATTDEARDAARASATDVDARARALQSGGAGSLLGDVYGGGRGYTSGERDFDAALAGGAAGGALRGTGAQYSYFSSMLGMDPPTQTPRPGANAGDSTPGGGGSGGSGAPRGGLPDLSNPLAEEDLQDIRRRHGGGGNKNRGFSPFASLLGD